MTPPWFVLTGAPSSGKTTLLREIGARGYRTVEEAARFVIERETAQGRDFRELRADAAWFQHEVLRYKVAWESQAPRDETIFFDRGIPDSIAYYRAEGVPEDEELRDAVAASAYRRIFILDLISRDTFTEDGARSESWEDAVELDRMLEEAYRTCGYETVRVPVMPIQARTDFVCARMLV